VNEPEPANSFGKVRIIVDVSDLDSDEDGIPDEVEGLIYDHGIEFKPRGFL